MKKLLIILILLIPTSASCWWLIARQPVAAPAASCTTTATDDFSGANLDDYTAYNGGSWSLDTVNDNLDAPTSTNDAMLVHDTTTTTIKQWAKFTITTVEWLNRSGVVMRVSGATAQAYQIYWRDAQDIFYWDSMTVNRSNFETVESYSASAGWLASGDTVGVAVEGTGNDTVVYVWKNPSGATQCDWGVADVTFTNNPTNAADIGTGAGLFDYSGSSPTTFDDFSFGDW